MKSLREIKEKKVDIFKNQLGEAKTVILTNYKGLTVYSMEDLRTRLREVGGQVSVIKNTLAKVALNDLGIDVPQVADAVPAAVEGKSQKVAPVGQDRIVGKPRLELKVIEELADDAA